MHTETHSHIHGHTSCIHIATKSSKHTHMRALSFLTLLVPLPNITSPVGGYSTLATQPYLCKACYLTKYTYVLVPREWWVHWACWWKKTRSRQSLALRDMGHIQEITHRDPASCSATRERGYTGERERQCKRMRLQYLPVFHWSLIKMTNSWKNAAGAPSVRFLVDFSV